MILAVLRTLALHQTLFCIAENAPCIFFTGYPEQERDVIVRNALCTVFCAYFSALGILGNAPDTLRNTFGVRGVRFIGYPSQAAVQHLGELAAPRDDRPSSRVHGVGS